jgi:asparagine synthase (glutamine-hydrolysing)
MCGFAGGYFHSVNNFTVEKLDKMLAAIDTRGPDDHGTWNEGNLYFGHNRLSIHDLSDAGHQPMVSEDGQCVLIFNGEIYNYLALRHQIERQGHTFKSDCDTEVLISALVLWGVDRTLSEVDGMFAFVLWNKKTKRLVLARDRMGEKPLYWGKNKGDLVFASELKSIQALYGSGLEIDTSALDLFLQFSYIPAPYSIYENISKVLPGHYLCFDLNRPQLEPESVQYWQFHRKPNASFSESGAVEVFEDTLANVLEMQLAADVPVGTFLSGGIDSSLITAMISQNLGVDVSTFSIGFEHPDYDESGFSEKVAQHLGTNHYEHIFSEADMLDLVPKMAAVYSEPFADSSQIPTYLLCQMARQNVTVALSGDAADELFFGYSRYQKTLRRWQKVKRVPRWFRQAITPLSRLAESCAHRLPIQTKWAEALRRGLRYSSAGDFRAFYRDAISFDWNVPQAHTCYFDRAYANALSPSLLLMDIDSHHYLPEDILVKVDRASMAHSLEVRVPYLSKPMLDLAQQLDMPLLLNRDKGKWLLRQLLYKYVPEALIERPKQGFGVPMENWLKGAIREWAEELIHSNLTDQVPSVDHEKYRRYWLQHQDREFDWSGQLWNYLQLLNWLRSVHLKEC